MLNHIRMSLEVQVAVMVRPWTVGAGRLCGHGRRAGSFYWYGLANMDYWVDPNAGIAVVANSHFFPWQDPAWVEYIAEVEQAIYDGLEPKGRL